MIDPTLIDDLAKKLEAILPSQLTAIQADIQQQFSRVLAEGLKQLELVSREEFDVQRKVLARTREKVDAIEAQLASHLSAETSASSEN